MALPADAQRDRAVAVLKRAYAEGRLELEEFSDRSERVLHARSMTELRLQLRGLFADDLGRRARRAGRIAATVAVWFFLSSFLFVTGVVMLIATHGSVWTLLFPLAWLFVTVLAWRELRRAP
jgi:hypothetical protein